MQLSCALKASREDLAMKGRFSPDDARRFYDRFGAKQDWQSFYENHAVKDMIAHAAFEHAHSVFEFGFGTGRLAELLLSRHLPQDASYTGIDISSTMGGLARERLKPWQDRVTLHVSDGSTRRVAADNSFDRFVSTYVLDLMSEDSIKYVLGEAHRILKSKGKLCLVSLTRGDSPVNRVVTGIWNSLYSWRPNLVGGCRPIELRGYLGPSEWRIEHHATDSSYGISSEIVIASRTMP